MLNKNAIEIFVVLMISLIFNQEIEYVIYTDQALIEAANTLSDFYKYEIDDDYKLNTKIIINDTLTIPINDWISNELSINSNLEYLLILGDETIIPPIYYGINSSTPSDDYYSSSTLSNSTPPIPTLKTGRIIVNNSIKANESINKIKTYVLNGDNELWKNKLLLLCDNEYKSGRSIRQEKYHTIYSDNIYNNLKNLLPIINLYGTDFDMQESSDWYTQPELTNSIINTINNGVGIINYIGHGTHEILADEDILKMDRDLNLINTNNKLPIWVVGTCSFGNYDNNICMAEELLNRDDAAIAVITTTRGILSTENYNYLNDLFNTHLKDHILNNEKTRLGDIFYLAKGSTSQSYRFHLFGDPALPLFISKKINNLIETNLDSIYIGSQNNLTVNSNNATLNIYNEEQKKIKYFEYEPFEDDTCSVGISCFDTLEYSLYGNKLFDSDFNEQIDYYIPLDINLDNKVKALVYDKISNQIEIIDSINLVLNIDNNLINDNSGPEIYAYFNNSELSDLHSIFSPFDLHIEIEDDLPINLSGLNSHNIRLWIDTNNNSFILNNYFVPTSNSSGYINFTLEDSLLSNEQHLIYIEAWDMINNHSIKEYQVNIMDIPNNIYNVYNIPNPFKERTFFTFNIKNPQPLFINIDILSKNGTILNSFSDFIDLDKNYFAYPNNGWDGRDQYNNKLQNGTYLYRLKIKNINNIIIYNRIHNITIYK